MTVLGPKTFLPHVSPALWRNKWGGDRQDCRGRLQSRHEVQPGEEAKNRSEVTTVGECLGMWTVEDCGCPSWEGF